MVEMLASSTVNRRLKPRSGQSTKDCKIGTLSICYFSAKYAVLRSKCGDWLAKNQDNVSQWSDLSTPRLLFQ
jgi:hypothetical protein